MKPGDIYDSVNDGKFEIIENKNWYEVRIMFPSGFENIVNRQQVTRGKVKDYFKPVYFGIGFIGERGLTKVNYKSTTYYNRWKRMLSRCYNKNDKNYKNYGGAGVTVCKDWFNLQSYIEWASKYKLDGMDIDKDIKSIGELIYSPETCSVVTHEENCGFSFRKRYSILSPSGEILQIDNMKKFCRDNGLTSANMYAVIRGRRSQHKGYSAIN